MPDITMCQPINCKHQADCYRAVAEPNHYRQSYFIQEPYNLVTKDCEYYAPVREGDHVRSE